MFVHVSPALFGCFGREEPSSTPSVFSPYLFISRSQKLGTYLVVEGGVVLVVPVELVFAVVVVVMVKVVIVEVVSLLVVFVISVVETFEIVVRGVETVVISISPAFKDDSFFPSSDR